MTEIPPNNIQINQEDGSQERFLFEIPNQEEKQTILKRIQRITGDTRTHGIEIQKQQVSIPDKKEKLELNVWDFGGQHEYYNNHHYFLSARSIFLVVWNVTEGDEGVKGLEFWLKSLKYHLPEPQTQQEKDKSLYSIIVVGTHID